MFNVAHNVGVCHAIALQSLHTRQRRRGACVPEKLFWKVLGAGIGMESSNICSINSVGRLSKGRDVLVFCKPGTFLGIMSVRLAVWMESL